MRLVFFDASATQGKMSWPASVLMPSAVYRQRQHHALVAVIEGRFGGHGHPDLAPLEVHPVEPFESGVGRGGLLVLDDAVALRLSGGVVLVDAHRERPLVLVAPLLLSTSNEGEPITAAGR